MPKTPEIPVRITGDNREFRRALRGAGSDADQFQARVAKNAAMIRRAMSALAAGGVVAAGTRLVRSAVQQAKEIENLSAISGIGAEQFQRFAAGADTVGISQEKLADVLKDVNDKFGDFTANRAGPLKDFFDNIGKQAGVTADQFARLSGPEALQLYVSSLEKAGVSQQQMTFYMEALASDATALLPLLRDNGAGLKKLGEQAQNAGAVIDDALIRRGSEIADKWHSIMNSMARASQQFALQAATAIDNALGFTDSGRLEMKKDQLQKVGQEYVLAMKDSLVAERQIAAERKRMAENELAGAPGISGTASRARLKALENDLAQSKAVMDASLEEQEALKTQIADIDKLRIERQNRLSALAGGVDPIKPGDKPKAGGGGGRSTTEMERLADQWKTKLELLRDQQEKELEIVENARQRGLIGEQRYQELLTRLAQEHADQRAQINRVEAASRVNMVLGAGEDVLSAMGAFNDRALRMAQVFGTAQALISTYQGAAEALKLPFPANFAAASAVLAKGLGFVAAIGSVGKGSTGVSTGGGGGVGGAVAAQAPLEVRLTGLGDNDILRGSDVGKIVDMLSREAGDRGVKLLIGN